MTEIETWEANESNLECNFMKWKCSHCNAINPSGSFKCHNCPNTCGYEGPSKLQIAIMALEEIESGPGSLSEPALIARRALERIK